MYASNSVLLLQHPFYTDSMQDEEYDSKMDTLNNHNNLI